MHRMKRHESDNDAPIVDPQAFGRLVRAARIVAGFDTVRDAAAAMAEASEVHVPDRSLYAIERGEQKPTLEFFFAVVMTFRPPGGTRFFMRALRPDLIAALIDTAGGPDGAPRGPLGNG